MNISIQSPFSGKINTMDLPINQSQLAEYMQNKVNIQDLFPHLDAEQREFLKTGIAPGEWPGEKPE